MDFLRQLGKKFTEKVEESSDLSKQTEESRLGLQSALSAPLKEVAIESFSEEIQILRLEENTNCTEMDSASKAVEEKNPDSKEQEENKTKDSNSNEEEKGCIETDWVLEEVGDKGCIGNDSALGEVDVKDKGSALEEVMVKENSCAEKGSALGEVEVKENSCAEKDSALEEVAVKGKGCDLKEEEEKGSDTKEEKNEVVSPYPVRLDEPDCTFYVRTGMCKFGLNCKFNHPPRHKNQVGLEGKEDGMEKEKGEEEKENEEKENEMENENEEVPHYPEREGQPECKYYLKTGVCKFGKECRYNHPREKAGMGEPVDLNFLGLPIRPGERECPFYMRTGSCKFATNCKFHHPNPTAVGGFEPPSVYRNDNSLTFQAATPPLPLSTAWSRTSNEPVPYIEASPPPYVSVMYSTPHGVHPNPEWNGFLGPGSAMFPLERNLKPPSAASMFDPPMKADCSTRQLQTMVDEFPERPGQPECQFYMKNGNCKFRSACRYHHPKPRVSKSLGCVLNSRGLPLRPDQSICSHYSRYGICKFGPSCKYDHPIDCGPTATPMMPASDQPTLCKSSEEANVHT